jgi:hypothetical protein
MVCPLCLQIAGTYDVANKTESHGSDKEAKLHNLQGDEINEGDVLGT